MRKAALSLFVVSAVARAAAAAFRPPAVPIVVTDPFFSLWSAGDKLTDVDVTHWSGAKAPVSIVAEIEGRSWRLLGAQPADVPALPQTALEVTPLATRAQFAADGIEVELVFLQAAVPHDFDLLSLPVARVEVSARRGGSRVPFRLMVDVSARVATDDDAALATAECGECGGSSYARVGRTDQTALSAKGDCVRPDWGWAYVYAPERAQFAAATPWAGCRPSACDQHASLAWPCEGDTHFLLAYDDVRSIRFFDFDAPAWWRRNGQSFHQMLVGAEMVFDRRRDELLDYDARLAADLRKAGGEKYARLAALAWRQSIGACKLVADPNGQPLFLSKENGSGGCIGTVDVFYPQLPHLLLAGPALVKATLAPILLYAASSRWPHPYAPHDVGIYPFATGQSYRMGRGDSDAARMPVEECGNMLICLAALAKLEGSAAFACRWWPQVAGWAAYLEKQGFDPENQLCTDDFAGHLAHNANLSVKSIVALRAFALLAEMRGEKDVAEKYARLAADLAAKWVAAAKGGGAGGARLAVDLPDSWSQKYNLVWDRLLGFNLFPPSVAEQELAEYRRRALPYGLPLDSRKTYTKADWIVWCAMLTGRKEDFDFLVDPLYRYADETPSRVPLSDWYQADTGRHVAFLGRSVVGAFMLPLAADGKILRRRAAMDANAVGDYAPLDPPKSAVGKALEPFTGDWDRVPGAVAVTYAGGKFTVVCVGFADLKTKRPMRPSTKFWFASNTKGIAAATLLTVVDDGLLSLDDRVDKHVPGFHSGVTIRQVLSHTSGLPFFPEMPIDARSVQQLAQIAARTQLDFAPGTKYQYSNWGIDVAMAAMENATGEPFEKTMRTRVLEPLGMFDTTFWPSGEDLVTFYVRESDGAALREKCVDQCQYPYDLHSRFAEAGGGLFGTGPDLAKFFAMIADGGRLPSGRRLLSDESFREWCARQTPSREMAYSFGMAVGGPGVLSHGGSGGTSGWADSRSHVARVLLLNLHGNFQARREFTAAWDGLFRPAKRN